MHRVVVTTLLGFVLGVVCAWLSVLFKPVEPITFLGLVGVVYNRTLVGFLIGLEREWRPEWLKGAVIGALVSWAMTLPYYGIYGLGFALFGAIYGAVIGFVAERYG